ncbi:hypothetical protein, partial [Muriicola jejuensis]|uniref:hypothetical protein n=1 Tax=Muriicola jejuensis TaxID=504488 RepID=UPI001952BEE4
IKNPPISDVITNKNAPSIPVKKTSLFFIHICYSSLQVTVPAMVWRLEAPAFRFVLLIPKIANNPRP